MPQYTIAIARLCVDGTHRQEISNFLCQAERSCIQRGFTLLHIPIAQTPATVARNKIVAVAQERKVDLLFMLDDDMGIPSEFFDTAVDFLLKQPRPSVIGVPYCTSPPVENVNVIEWATSETGCPSPKCGLVSITREDAARRKGIERVHNIGTGGIAYDLRVFHSLRRPYYDYLYNDDYTAVIETEDCYCHRLMGYAGIPVYCAWSDPVSGQSLWADHYKTKRVMKPLLVEFDNIRQIFMEQARAELKRGDKDLASLIPQDVPGWCDYAAFYERMVGLFPDDSHFVEVGSWQGQSAIVMARLIQRSGKRIRFTCVDHFRGSPKMDMDQTEVPPDLRERFEDNLRRHGVLDRVNLLPLPSLEAAKLFPDDSLDFVFIDASHEEADVRADIEAWQPKVRMGGVLAGHDLNWGGVMRAVGASFPDRRIETQGNCWIWQKLPEEKKREKGLIA